MTTFAEISCRNEMFDNNEYESASLTPPVEESEALKVYDYVPHEASKDDDEYDYESPYWAPSDKKAELLSQFKKLRIQSVTQKELE